MSSSILYRPLSLNTCHYSQGTQPSVLPATANSLLLLLHGKGSCSFNGGIDSYRLLPGMCLSQPIGAKAELLTEGEEPLVLACLQYEEAYPSGLFDHTPFTLSMKSAGAMVPAATLRSIVARLDDAIKDPSVCQSYRALSLFYELIALIVERTEDNPSLPVTPDAVGADDGRHQLEQAIQYMKRHLAEPLQIAELAGMIGLTPSSFSRSFKQRYGVTPLSYLTKLRIEEAQHLMTGEATSLRDISERVGFQDTLYFSKVFKRLRGVAPTIYIKRSLQKIAVVSGLNLHDQLLSLGVQPVAAPSFPSFSKTRSGFPIYLQDQLNDTVPINAEHTIAIDEVIRLEPDLILKCDFKDNPNDPYWLHAANTVFLPNHDQWEDYLRDISVHIKKEAAAERVLANVRQAETVGRDALAPLQRKGAWAIIRLLPGDCRLYGTKSHALSKLFYEQLEFSPAPRVDFPGYRGHALELLVQINPERILIIWSEPQVVAEFTRHPLWQQLRAVRDNHVYYPDSKHWGAWGPIGRVHMIRSMCDYFLERV